jgi:hypothetical protein
MYGCRTSRFSDILNIAGSDWGNDAAPLVVLFVVIEVTSVILGGEPALGGNRPYLKKVNLIVEFQKRSNYTISGQYCHVYLF